MDVVRHAWKREQCYNTIMTQRTIPPHARMIPPEAQCVFVGEIFRVYQWPQRLYDGSVATFEMVRRPDTVFIIAVDDTGKVLVNDEEQPGGIVRRGHLPAGRVDPEDATIIAAAQRELREETGWEFADWQLLEVVQPETKMEWFEHLVLARRPVHHMPPRCDAGERITTRAISWQELVQSAVLLRHFPWLRDVASVEELAPRHRGNL